MAYPLKGTMLKQIARFIGEHYLEFQEKDPKIACLGGGTGLSTLLKGLKVYSRHITAIVTMCDEGGSSGRLRRTLGVPAVGDLRNCLAALSDDENTMTKLLRYRFSGNRYGNDTDLGGHSFGNLLLVALSDIMGDFNKGLEEAAHILNISGQVLPSTADDVHIWVETEDGQKVYGEENIDLGKYEGNRTIRLLHLDPPQAKAYPDAVAALRQANLVTCGPGDFYTSLMPNLLINEIRETLKEISVPKVLIINIANKPFETPTYRVSDFLKACVLHLGFLPFTHILVNNNHQPTIPSHLSYHYVIHDEAEVAKYPVHTRSADLIDTKNPLFHDPAKLAAALASML